MEKSKLQDKLDNEIIECKKYRSKFMQGRRELDAKMEKIVSGTYKKDISITPVIHDITNNQPSRNIADYRRNANDSILDATANCIVSLG
ncbi:MAG: hypothetical protein WCF23_06385 [Candidatus Nitrosopolaris sp.]